MRLPLRLPRLVQGLRVRANLAQRVLEVPERGLALAVLELPLGASERDDHLPRRLLILIRAHPGRLLDEPVRGDGLVGPDAGRAHLPPELRVHLQQARVQLADLVALLARLVPADEGTHEPNRLTRNQRADQVLVVHLQTRELHGEVLAENLLRLREL